MRVLLLSRYSRLGASSRLRFFQYLPYLNANGIDVDIAPLLNDTYLKDLYSGKPIDVRNVASAFLRRFSDFGKCRHYDLIWIEYEVLPWLPALAERLLFALGIPYIVDYDDAIFHRYDQHPNALIRYMLGHKIDKVMQKAALVIAGNQYLADRAGAAGAKWIEILPTVIDLERYPVEAPRERSGFTIGWIGSPTMAPYLSLLREAFIKVSRQSDVRLMLIGSDRSDFDFMPVSALAWSEETEAADIQNFDVGIMPMPDTLWTRGKCGYKLIQYMACGRPVIASGVGVNMEIVAHGENGFLASTPSEWVEAFTALRDSGDLRTRMGLSGRRKVESTYCLQVTAPKLLSWFEAIARTRGFARKSGFGRRSG